MPRSLAEIRARARAHEEEIESLRWFTPEQLKQRWGFRSVSTIYAIPVAQLRYKPFGIGPRPRRRYRQDWVEAFENADGHRNVIEQHDQLDAAG